MNSSAAPSSWPADSGAAANASKIAPVGSASRSRRGTSSCQKVSKSSRAGTPAQVTSARIRSVRSGIRRASMTASRSSAWCSRRVTASAKYCRPSGAAATQRIRRASLSAAARAALSWASRGPVRPCSASHPMSAGASRSSAARAPRPLSRV
ncbi:hypothetical protein [Dactylosporangium maewongense]|uniref:hypothetical protein n=1 Tax=Dactylosporangium maewongense TaxID=634393 RepID=UPI0031CF614E